MRKINEYNYNSIIYNKNIKYCYDDIFEMYYVEFKMYIIINNLT